MGFKLWWWHGRRRLGIATGFALIVLGIPLNLLCWLFGLSFAKPDDTPMGLLNASSRHAMICGIITLVVIIAVAIV
jgi:hypothetical protein